MIAAWMAYTVAISLLLWVGAAAAEYLARAFGAPTRFVWVSAALLAIALSARALATREQVYSDDMAPVAAVRAADAPAVTVRPGIAPAAGAVALRRATRTGILRLLTPARSSASALRRLPARLDVAGLDRWNAALVAAWIVASGLATINLILSMVGVCRMERRLACDVVDGTTVLVSDDVGPALLGVLHARIIVPRWVLEMPCNDRQLIFSHERQHVAARDPLLLWSAAVLVAIAPWNIGLWLLLARLRLALEADCDRRVLGARGDARRYGGLLMSVYERTRATRMPAVAFGERSSNLERRIRRLMGRPRLWSRTGGASVLGMAIVVTAAWTVPAPGRRTATATVHPTIVSSARSGLTQRSGRGGGAARTDQPSARRLPLMTSVAVGSAVDEPELRITESNNSTVTQAPVVWRDPVANVQGSRDDCGFAMQHDELCSADGTILIRLVDRTHLVVAVGDSNDAAGTQPVAHLFMVTSARPILGVTTQLMVRGHVEFQRTALYVVQSNGGNPGLLFGPPGATLAFQHPGAERMTDLVGIAQYWGSKLTFELIRQLTPSPECAAKPGITGADSPGQVGYFIQGKPVAEAGRPLFVVDGVVISQDTARMGVASANRQDASCYEAGGIKIVFP